MSRPRPVLKNQWAVFVNDCLTTQAGEYDLAKVTGYIGTQITGFVFIGLAIYDTVQNKKFDYLGFSAAACAIGAMIAGAAAAVRIKHPTENKPGEVDALERSPLTTAEKESNGSSS